MRSHRMTESPASSLSLVGVDEWAIAPKRDPILISPVLRPSCHAPNSPYP